MLGTRAVSRLWAKQPMPVAAAPSVDDVVETPLVPCNNLRAHWVKTPDGKLELRWELDGADLRHDAA